MVLAVLILAAVIFSLGRVAIINAERKEAEKKRGDTLQQGLNALRQRSEEDRQFFETIRQLMVSQSAEERQKLVEELRNFKFSTSSTTTTTIKSKSSSKSSSKSVITSTSTTPSSSSTTAPRPPPSTTTTTRPTSPPPNRPCVTTPVANVCPPQPTRNERNHRYE